MSVARPTSVDVAYVIDCLPRVTVVQHAVTVEDAARFTLTSALKVDG